MHPFQSLHGFVGEAFSRFCIWFDIEVKNVNITIREARFGQGKGKFVALEVAEDYAAMNPCPKRG